MGNGTAVVMLLRKVIKINWAGQAAVARDRALRVRPMEALGYVEAKQRFERNYLVQLLKLTAGNVTDAARIAGRNRTEFYRLLQRYDLDPGLFRGDVAEARRA